MSIVNSIGVILPWGLHAAGALPRMTGFSMAYAPHQPDARMTRGSPWRLHATGAMPA
jgi:hypothetical protein